MAFAGIIFLGDLTPKFYDDYKATLFAFSSYSGALVHVRLTGGNKKDLQSKVDEASAVLKNKFAAFANATHVVEIYRNLLDDDDNVREQQFLYAMAIQVPPILRRPEMLPHIYKMCDPRLQHEPDYFIYDIKSIGELSK
ncbi:hypothetical protein LU11_gp331 [Pseudomonas phage Lu11]|uniref:hypothetical protein n=1 Tax=Pseudomonas phage Lu11 TaxID=1161927 RepID=UPI00025F1875|nr:hypothetical protein LU11_gp331 [Pseudomonas phage Lu11]AFH14862.1 hypothetical protein Lu11_0324 [Pseudomonas phage Lu11]